VSQENVEIVRGALDASVREIHDARNEMVVAPVRMLGGGDATAAEVGTQVYGVVFTVRSGKIVRVEEAAAQTAFKIGGIQE
jgi:hypothetical protein